MSMRQPVRIIPSLPRGQFFEEITTASSVSREGPPEGHTSIRLALGTVSCCLLRARRGEALEGPLNVRV
jgi:hypothetical protein